MAKFKDKNDVADISSKNGAEWYHFCKNEFIDFIDSLKEDEPNEVKIGS